MNLFQYFFEDLKDLNYYSCSAQISILVRSNHPLSLSLSLAPVGQSQSRRRRGYAGSYAGGYAGGSAGVGGYTGGYNGGYNDYDDYGDGGHYVSNFGITDPYLFHQQLTNHILAQNYANQQ